MAHSTYGSWLVLMDLLNRGGDYAMIPADDFYATLTTKFKTYDGLKLPRPPVPVDAGPRRRL